MDAQVLPSMARNIGRQALADFFASMATQKAHWYNLANSSPSDAPHTMIDSIFPKLSTLLSVEPKIMDSMLQLCGLSQERRGRMTPVLGTWTNFISEERVDIEITTFAIEKRGFTSSGLVHGTRQHTQLSYL